MLIKGTKIKERPKTSCVFYGRVSGRTSDAPYCTLTTYAKCDPDTCPWYKSQEMMDASYEKARQNYIKNHGADDYYRLGYGPKPRHSPRKNPDDKEENK